IDSSRVDYQARRLAWTRLEDVSPAAREILVAAEDRRFRDHGGVDWMALTGAVRDRAEGKRGRGASTLSMQVAA
ncbi:transglycosylase domain-containing protein, partial [Salmonella enterica subsp. enterica serovar Heidelberg]|nr:transglycosylase domain-containing protein [Salmonella enterica subsp. enterica serovar Heidelberg]